jgi:hypothetical protein
MAYQDIPDIKTQIALNKVRGLTPNLTPAEQKAFADQQYLESEKQRIAQEKGLPNILGGDVRSYTGSMFAPVGSPMAAVPMPQGAPRVGEMGGGIDVNAYRGSMFGEGVMGAAPILGGSRTQPYNPNVSADAILGRAFGKRPAGQISVAPTTPQTYTQGQQTPSGAILGQGESVTMGGQARLGYTIGGPQYGVQPTGQTPSALTQNDEYFSRNLRGAPFQQVYGNMASDRRTMGPAAALGSFTGTQQQDILNQTQPVQPSMLGGAPISMPQQAQAMAPMLGAFQPGSAAYDYLQQRGAAPQTMGYAAQAAAASPQQRQFGIQERNLALQQGQYANEQDDRSVKQAAADLASGRISDISQANLPQRLLGQAIMTANTLKQGGRPMSLADVKMYRDQYGLDIKGMPSGKTGEIIVTSMGTYAPTPPPVYRSLTDEKSLEEMRRATASTETKLSEIEKGYDTATNYETQAKIAEKAYDSGASSGFGTPIKNLIFNALESAGIDTKAFEQQLLEKGLAGMQATGVRAIMSGLGSMSNADRDFATNSLPSLKDTELTNRFFIEMAKANAKFAKEDKKFQYVLERNATPKDEILRQLNERRDSRNVAEGIYNTVITKYGKGKVGGTSTSAPTTSTLTPTGQPTSFKSGRFNVSVGP